MQIIDLFSQRESVASQLREITDGGKLDWLRKQGELIEISTTDPDPTVYLFRTPAGIETKFVIRDGMMIFVGDNTTNDAVSIDRNREP